MTYFDVFGLAPSVDIDLTHLESRYRDLSLALHPDRHAQASSGERRLAAERTATLNEAFRVLKDPARRAFYVLKEFGVDLESESANVRPPLPVEFLEDILERREQLDAARAANDLARVATLGQAMSSDMKKALSEAQGALRLRLNADKPEAVSQAATALARVRYFLRFMEEVDAIEEASLA